MHSRATIAGIVTVVALGALAAVALASGSGGNSRAVQTRDDQPRSRTEVVHRHAARHHAATTRRDDHGRRHGGHGADDPATHDATDDRSRELEPGDDRGGDSSGRGGGNSGPGGGHSGHGGGDD